MASRTVDPAYTQQPLHLLGVANLLAARYETAATLLKQRILMVPKTDFSRAVVLTEPSLLLLARLLLYGYVMSRLLHFVAYFTAQTHDTRAAFWTAGPPILIFMTCRTLVAAGW